MVELFLIIATNSPPSAPKPSGYTPPLTTVSPPATPKPVYASPSPAPQPVYTPPPSESWSDKMWRRYKESSK